MAVFRCYGVDCINLQYVSHIAGHETSCCFPAWKQIVEMQEIATFQAHVVPSPPSDTGQLLRHCYVVLLTMEGGGYFEVSIVSVASFVV